MDVGTVLLLSGAGILLLAVLAKVFTTPLRLALKAAVNTILGLGALVVLNAVSSFTGVSLGVNLFNALVVGVLGVPGLGLLLLIQWVLT